LFPLRFPLNHDAVLSVCAVLIGHEAFRIWTSRDAALRDARKDTANLARSLAQHAEDTIRTVDGQEGGA
jgi:hypothetical protein